MGSKLWLLFFILPKIVNGSGKRTKYSLKKKANPGVNPMLLNNRVAVMKYRLSPAAVLLSKTESN